MRNAIVTTLAVLVAAAASGQIVTTRPSSAQFLIPAAGAQAGNGGTFFRSDITIVNYRPVDQRIRLQWLPQDVSGGSGAPVEITIAASSGIASEDFVTTVMQRSGLGAILVTAIDATGLFDSRAQLVGTSRIWTPQPGTSGTTSQSLPSISTGDISSTTLGILGARRGTTNRRTAVFDGARRRHRSGQYHTAADSGAEQDHDRSPVSVCRVRIIGRQHHRRCVDDARLESAGAGSVTAVK